MAGNGYIDDVNGFNFEADTADITDENGHGTHCAGVIAAQESQLSMLQMMLHDSLLGRGRGFWVVDSLAALVAVVF
eukprot:3891645-Amphidinium_carterae.1